MVYILVLDMDDALLLGREPAQEVGDQLCVEVPGIAGPPGAVHETDGSGGGWWFACGGGAWCVPRAAAAILSASRCPACWSDTSGGTVRLTRQVRAVIQELAGRAGARLLAVPALFLSRHTALDKE